MLKITTGTVSFVPKWNDNDKESEPIQFELSRLTFEDYWRAMAVCSYLGDSQNKTDAAKIASCGEIIREITHLVKKYVIGVSGLYVDDALAKSEDLTKTAQFFPLIIETIGELLRISTLDDGLKKKSEAPSPDENKTI